MAAESMKTAHPRRLHHWWMVLLYQFVGLPDYLRQQVLVLLLVVLVGQDELLEVLAEEAVA